MNKIALNGRYTAYPQYKNSEIEWLGDIPSHWEASPVKYLSDSVSTGGTPKNQSSFTDKNQICWFSPGDFDGRKVLLSSSKYVTHESCDIGDARLYQGGSVVVIGIGATLGKVAYCPNSFSCNQQINIIEPNGEILGMYLMYSLAVQLAQMKQISNSSTIGIMNQEKTKTILVAYPSRLEQEKIANFLDHETAKIDTLIDKQKQLIKLLKEKRQAVISHAVTKGLNPDAPMRDSGVEWLGEVPRHWKMVPLKYLCNFSGGGTPSKDNLSYWTGGDIPWVSPKDMKSFWILDTQDKLTEKAVKESSTNFVNAGALLMVVRSGILQRTIPIAINKVKVTLNQDMKALKFNERMDAEYTANYIIGNVSSLLLEWSKEGATVESIEQEYLSGSLMPVPPLGEQAAINEVINARMVVFQRLEEQALKGITLLQERCSALISEAVTGKIDVRHFTSKKGHAPKSATQEAIND
ncbi:restriction endonuclease subunit S [Colwellia sp. MB02u-10]|uniref:restriction endonuclease subunit S n=1 Tax=Colwellia sp. MB02u-10 TaxID=2759828 RepID=UPI0015F3E59B|nr:restriction endonuclease subunit S [Colwellia sp. MB02u-10]MBA6343019.1 restriction endonuclease subunit S [Colwellia sp. MB02u-10]